MKIGKFFRRAIAPVLRVAAPVAALVSPAAGAAAALLGSAGRSSSDQAPQAPPVAVPVQTGGIDDLVREQARRLVDAADRSLPALASAGLAAAIRSRTAGMPETRFLPLPAGLVGPGQAQLAARTDQRADRTDVRESLRQASCASSPDRPAQIVVNITNTQNLMRGGGSLVDAPRPGASRRAQRARLRRKSPARARTRLR